MTLTRRELFYFDISYGLSPKRGCTRADVPDELTGSNSVTQAAYAAPSQCTLSVHNVVPLSIRVGAGV